MALKEKITRAYYLTAADVLDQCALSYNYSEEEGCFVIVPRTVFAVGFNDNYIIVKQHPDNNKKHTNYFIVPICTSDSIDIISSAIGLLTLNEFNAKKQELKIPENLTFTIIKKALQ